ncbi:MAG: TIGR00304 family membrane protein [Candidatus Baldrarchaeia archaeon]
MMYNSTSNIVLLTGFFLVFLGVMIIFLAIIIFMFKSIKGKVETKGGGIIFIGPIPIIFGTDIRITKWLIIIALIITLILLFSVVILHML